MQHDGKAVFVDRDGVINRNRKDHVKSWEEFQFLPGAIEALARLSQHGYQTVIVTNQAMVNRGIVPRNTVDEIHRRMVQQIEEGDGRVAAVVYCPHRPEEKCDCRKPQPGLLRQAARQLELDLAKSYFIGDAVSDVATAKAAGCLPILVLTGRGLRQFLSLRARRFSGYHVARNLGTAVKWILKRDGEIDL